MGRPKGSKNKPKTAKGNQDKTSTKARPASNYIKFIRLLRLL